mgnify:CR=1 FL=1
MPREKIIFAIACYLKAIERYVPAQDFIEIDFNDVVHDTVGVVERLRVFLPELKPYEMVLEEIQTFIDKNLKGLDKIK